MCRFISRRIEDLDQSLRIHALELALKNQNNEHGLGFTLLDGSTVLDKKKLATLFFAVFSLLVSLSLSRLGVLWLRGRLVFW